MPPPSERLLALRRKIAELGLDGFVIPHSNAHQNEFLPPNGGILLARDSSGYLLGCGFVRMIDDKRAELKRLYVRDIARGYGLGRRIIEMRIEKAKELGLEAITTNIYSDNLIDNIELNDVGFLMALTGNSEINKLRY